MLKYSLNKFIRDMFCAVVLFRFILLAMFSSIPCRVRSGYVHISLLQSVLKYSTELPSSFNQRRSELLNDGVRCLHVGSAAVKSPANCAIFVYTHKCVIVYVYVYIMQNIYLFEIM